MRLIVRATIFVTIIITTSGVFPQNVIKNYCNKTFKKQNIVRNILVIQFRYLSDIRV